ncbi:hypothetical protein C3L50_08625 [Flavobacterium alvei]|uniref:RiboL-PSP-HEPN domain-containing protein n=1 Tax=Flavobacterium alvei TaxID=2080416 RepID=A0A2S5ABE8_9FLAO|nr:hypothetical protein [Flavobacterium alvei]POY39885.1 hypothetical protein C3L50_08625 [Flavobacterium alvei]
MPNLFFAKEELKFAKEALEQFKNTKEFLPNSKHWTDFLIHLELSFIKAERGSQDIKNIFIPFQGKYKKIRKIDPVLSYLKNARDAVSHGLETIVDLEIVSKKVVDKIQLSRLDENGNVIEITEHPMFPARIKLKTFTINGQIWNPPTYHRGKRLIYDKEPLESANLALHFYENFINEIEKL